MFENVAMVAATELLDWGALGYAFALLALAVALLLLEFFIVSFGVLLLSSLASVAAAIYLAFVASPITGWLFVLVTPIIAIGITRWGIQRIARSKLVTQAEVTSDAGYHHVLDGIGVGLGADGVMLTKARPTGRARFAGGDCDVQVRGRTIGPGAAVRIVSVDGPTVFVVAQDSAE